jgi:arylsulfatase A-like enzyme
VELLDIFPTLVGLAGLPAPAFPVDGDDVSALLTAFPSVPAGAKTAAFSQYSRCPDQDEPYCQDLGNPYWCKNNCEEVVASSITAMGYS